MNQMVLTSIEENTAIEKFIEIIKFPTISGLGAIDGSYDACGAWLLQELENIGLLSFNLKESKENKPIIIGTWFGSSVNLPAILLNSHYDVVPVVNESWIVPPFEGKIIDNNIYGRGTQDMKCVCVQYLVALRKLKEAGFIPIRTIHISFVPDEETGGIDGMNVLLQSEWFSTIKIELALDEGLANNGDGYSVFYGERLPWWVRFKAVGNTGHGSRFIDGTAVEQILSISNKALSYRGEQKDLLHGKDSHAGCSHAVQQKKKTTLGDVTSLNLTSIHAGVQCNGVDVINVVPPTAEVSFDIRISPHIETVEISNKLNLWCEEVNQSTVGLNKDQGVQWEFINNALHDHATTSTDTSVNPWWKLFENVLQNEFQISITAEVFPAATDSRFLRALGF
jgi:aminoacylase